MKRLRPSLVLFPSLLILVQAGLTAAETPTRSSWQCLPPETVAAMRLPALGDSVDLVRQTKAGAVMFAPERCDKVYQLVSGMIGDELAQAETTMTEWGFSVDDIDALIAGDMGAAFILLPPESESSEPLPMAVAWCQPSADLGDRLFAALDRLVAEHLADDPTFRRLDYDLDGAAIIELDMANRGSIAEGTDYGAVMIHRAGDRILAAMVPSPYLEPGKRAFLSFIRNHAAEGAGAFTGKVLATPGLAASLPQQGKTLFDCFADLRPVFAAMPVGNPETDQVRSVMTALGLDGITAMAMRTTMSPDGTAEAGAFAAMPVPRRGIPAMCDQKPLPTKPVDWVPATINSYLHLSVDLASLYQSIKDVALDIGGQTAQEAFNAAEMQVQAQTGVDMTQVLSAFGQRVVMMQLPHEEGQKIDIMAGDNPNTGALVWEVVDEGTATKLLQVAGGVLAMAGALYSEEQGFRGYRIPQPMGEGDAGGLFLGHGQFAFCFGKGAVSPVLSAIANPVAADARLATSPVVSTTATALPVSEATVYAVQDVQGHMDDFLPVMKQVLRQLLTESPVAMQLPPETDVDGIVDLIPETEELDGAFAPSVGAIWMVSEGMRYYGYQKLPMGEPAAGDDSAGEE